MANTPSGRITFDRSVYRTASVSTGKGEQLLADAKMEAQNCRMVLIRKGYNRNNVKVAINTKTKRHQVFTRDSATGPWTLRWTGKKVSYVEAK